MKSILILFTALFVHQGFACSPPPNALLMQLPWLRDLANSREVYNKMIALGGKDLKTIELKGGTLVVTSSTGCSFEAKVKYAPPVSPGMCPKFTGFELSEGSCPKE